jgi:hypothetical protein
MATFTLKIYGSDDNDVIKSYETNRIKYGAFLKALEIAEKAEKMTKKDFILAASDLAKTIFPDITDEEIANAEFTDVLALCKSVAQISGGVEGSSKN